MPNFQSVFMFCNIAKGIVFQYKTSIKSYTFALSKL